MGLECEVDIRPIGRMGEEGGLFRWILGKSRPGVPLEVVKMITVSSLSSLNVYEM
jgi:hypothetical protein